MVHQKRFSRFQQESSHQQDSHQTLERFEASQTTHLKVCIRTSRSRTPEIIIFFTYSSQS